MNSVRDSHRIREKYELSLDNKQIVTLFIAAIVVMGTVFVLGVVVGKNLSGSQRPSTAPDLLSALDQRAAAMEHVRTEPRLAFQDELTKKTPEVARAPESKRPEPKIAAEVKNDPEPAAIVPPPPETLERPESPQPAGQHVGAEPLARAEKRAGDRSASLAAPPRAEASDPGLKNAIARDEKQAPEPAIQKGKGDKHRTDLAQAAQAGKRAEQRPHADGAFTLQLAASQARADADRFAARMREKGYAPYVVESDVPGRGKWYRVRLGRFASREAAVKYLQDLKRETQLEAFVASSN